MMKTTENNRDFDAFISYKHDRLDGHIAAYLHKKLETYRIPRSCLEESYPYHFVKVFRDREELPITTDLNDTIHVALRKSRYLIVICSPRAKESKWVANEIEYFIKLGRADKIIPILIEGSIETSFPEPLLEYCRKKHGLEGELDSSLIFLKFGTISVKNEKLKSMLLSIDINKTEIISRILNYDRKCLESKYNRRWTISLYFKVVFWVALAFLPILFFSIQWVNSVHSKEYIEQQMKELEKYKAESEQQKQLSMSIIEKLTYTLPEKMKGIPGTIPVLTGIIDENIAFLDELGEIDSSSSSIRREKGVNFLISGNRWILLNDTAKALECYNKSIAIFSEQVKDPSNKTARNDLAITYSYMADALSISGDLPSAEENYNKSLDLYLELSGPKREKEYRTGLSDCYTGLFNICYALGKFDEAEKYCRESLDINTENLAQDKNNIIVRLDLAASYHNMGVLCYTRKDFESAKEYYRKAIDIGLEIDRSAVENQEEWHLSITYYNLGNIFLEQGDFPNAKDSYEKGFAESLKFASDLSNKSAQRDLYEGYFCFGEYYSKTNDYKKAEEYYIKALDICYILAEDKNNRDIKGDLLISLDRLGNLYYMSNDLTKSEEYYQKGIDACLRQPGYKNDIWISSTLAIFYTNLGSIQFQRDDLKGARDSYLKSIEISPGSTGQASESETKLLKERYVSLKGVYILLNDQDNAKKCETEIQKLTALNQ